MSRRRDQGQSAVVMRLGGWTFSLVGAALLCLGLFRGYFSLRLLVFGTRTTGTVAAYKIDSATHPVFRFVDRTGRERTETSRSAWGSSGTGHQGHWHAEGERVPILYEQAGVDTVMEDSFRELWLLPLLVGGVFGLGFTLAGQLLFRIDRLDRERATRRHAERH